MKRKLLFGLNILLAMSLLAGSAAALGAGYSLDWFTVDGGGGTSNGGNYSLTGTLGQPDAGALSGGNYSLAGGFWRDNTAQDVLYLPLIQR